MAVNPNVRPIGEHERKQFEGMGEAAVRQFCTGNVWPNAQDRSTHPMKVSALIWLAEVDEEAKKRAEALHAKEMWNWLGAHLRQLGLRLVRRLSRLWWVSLRGFFRSISHAPLSLAHALGERHYLGFLAVQSSFARDLAYRARVGGHQLVAGCLCCASIARATQKPARFRLRLSLKRSNDPIEV